jgi:hypothetical protein
MGTILWLIFLGLVVIVLQWYAGVKAREQIEDHIASIGGTVLSIERALRSNTVLGSPPKNGYVVTYLSRDGVELTVDCVATAHSGVYLQDWSRDPLAMKFPAPRRPVNERHRRQLLESLLRELEALKARKE